MSRYIQPVITAFMNGDKKTIKNTRTDGIRLYLFGHEIAKYENDELWVTTAGWDTKTTRDRLNHIPGVNVYRNRGKLFLNGEPWDGTWRKI